MSCQKRKLCNFVRALKLPLCLVRGAIDDTERERQRVGSQMKRVGGVWVRSKESCWESTRLGGGSATWARGFLPGDSILAIRRHDYGSERGQAPFGRAQAPRSVR